MLCRQGLPKRLIQANEQSLEVVCEGVGRRKVRRHVSVSTVVPHVSALTAASHVKEPELQRAKGRDVKELDQMLMSSKDRQVPTLIKPSSSTAQGVLERNKVSKAGT